MEIIDASKIKRLPSALTQEQIEELRRARSMPVTFDEDCPEITREQALLFRPAMHVQNRKGIT